MKTTILSLGICCLCSSPLFGQPTFKEAVDRHIAKYARSKDHIEPTVYPELAERIETLFRKYPVTHIVIIGSEGKAVKGTDDIYIKGEEIYVIRSNKDEWNLAANESGIFEWQTGKTNGIKLKRDNEDLVAYLYYLTDPSWIMASGYHRYQVSPKEFTVVADKGKKWSELRFKKPTHGFEAIYVSEKPLWFYGLRLKDVRTGRTNELTFSEPQELKELPKELEQQLKGIKFEESSLTLRRHLEFL